MCMTTNQPDTKSNPKPNPITKQHTIVGIQLDIVTCEKYPEKFMTRCSCNVFTATRYFADKSTSGHLRTGQLMD